MLAQPVQGLRRMVEDFFQTDMTNACVNDGLSIKLHVSGKRLMY